MSIFVSQSEIAKNGAVVKLRINHTLEALQKVILCSYLCFIKGNSPVSVIKLTQIGIPSLQIHLRFLFTNLNIFIKFHFVIL